MRLKKEDVYVSLKDKSKEELTDLYNFLESVGEKPHRDNLDDFLTYSRNWRFFEFSPTYVWCFSGSRKNTEVTIEQLKEIIKPDLKAQLENAKKEVERIENLIMEENNTKVGDWCKFWDNDKSDVCISKLLYTCHTDRYKYHTSESQYKNCEKITNAELIKLLEDESK